MARKRKHIKHRRKRSRKGKRRVGGMLLLIGLLVVLILLSLWLVDREYHKKSPEVAHPASDSLLIPESPEVVRPVSDSLVIPKAPKVVRLRGDSLAFPVCKPGQPAQIIVHSGYNVSYNAGWRLPNWVAYEHTRAKASVKAAERKNNFTTDPKVKGAAATSADYKGSGFDRGHMAPAADMRWSETAMRESFYFSNICPQHPRLNRQGWKQLEDKVRQWAASDSAIVVVCGPLVSEGSKLLGQNKVAVPHAFFKVILSPFGDEPQAIGFIFDNERAAAPLRNYIVCVDSVEVLTGIDFFSSLPHDVESKVEAVVDTVYWGL